MMKLIPPLRPEYEKACTEINEGPFSVLSEKAKDRLKALCRLCNDDGYIRGMVEGKRRELKKTGGGCGIKRT